MSFFSISSPNLSFIPQAVSEKIDAEVTNTAFSIWSVPNSATKGIQAMQAVWNLPISACLPTVFPRGSQKPARSQALIGRFETAYIAWIPLVAEFGTDHIEKAVFVTSASIFSETVGRMKRKFGEEIEKKLIYQDPSLFRWDFQYFCVNSSLKWRRSRLTAAKLQALSPSYVITRLDRHRLKCAWELSNHLSAVLVSSRTSFQFNSIHFNQFQRCPSTHTRQPRGVYSRCQSRGLGISVPRGDPLHGIWHTCFRKMDEFIGKDTDFVKDWLVRQGLEKLVDVLKDMFSHFHIFLHYL